jgi:hypothetical protein
MTAFAKATIKSGRWFLSFRLIAPERGNWTHVNFGFISRERKEAPQQAFARRANFICAIHLALLGPGRLAALMSAVVAPTTTGRTRRGRSPGECEPGNYEWGAQDVIVAPVPEPNRQRQRTTKVRDLPVNRRTFRTMPSFGRVTLCFLNAPVTTNRAVWSHAPATNSFQPPFARFLRGNSTDSV